MRSSFITLTFAVVCLLGSSLASPVYDKRALGGIVQAAGRVAQGALGTVTPLVDSAVRRSVPGDDDSVHLYKRQYSLKKILKGAHAALKHAPFKPVSAKNAGVSTASTVAKRDSSINSLSDDPLPTL